MRRLIVCAIAVLAATTLLAAPVEAKGKGPRADGTIRLEEKSVAVGIGYSWGGGTLRWRGKTVKFKIDGLTVQAVGASESEATGYVYNLKKLSDFPGTYAAIAAGAAAGGGKGITSMKNANGVRITLRFTARGAEATAGPEGVKISLK